MCEEEVKGRGEDEMHYLLECSAWSAERKEYLEPMREQVERAIRRGSTRAEAVAILLGGSVRGVRPRSLRRAVRQHERQLRADEAALAADQVLEGHPMPMPLALPLPMPMGRGEEGAEVGVGAEDLPARPPPLDYRRFWVGCLGDFIEHTWPRRLGRLRDYLVE